MFARIVQGRVAQVTEEMPALAPGECAHVEECGGEVREGWLWGPAGFAPPAPPTPAEINAAHNAGIDAEILALEVKQHRAVRELTLGDPETLARLQAFDDAIAALRAQRVTA